MKAYLTRLVAFFVIIFIVSYTPCWANDHVKTIHIVPQVIEGSPVHEAPVEHKRSFSDFLFVYKQYADFLIHIKTLQTADVLHLLAIIDDQYLINKAENDWIKELYRRQDFEGIGLFYSRVKQLDKVAQCQVWQSFAEAHKKSVWTTIFDHYLDPSLPSECLVLMDTLTRSHFLTENDRWARAHMLWDNMHYAFFIEHMHIFHDSHFPIAWIQKMIVDPLHFVRSFLHANSFSHAEKEAIIMALSSTLYKQFDDNWALWQILGPRLDLDTQQKNYIYMHLAYAASRLHKPISLSLYQYVDFHVLDPIYLEWYLRAAIHERNWHLLVFLIENLPITLREKTVWVYWLAYAKARLGDIQASDRLYASISSQLNYYGVLASEEIGRAVIIPPSVRVKESEIQHVLQHKGILRGIALFKKGSFSDAINEWHWANKEMDENGVLASSYVAYAYGMYDRAIFSLESLHKKSCFLLGYPAPYQDALKMAAEMSGLPKSWILGVMRQESRFLYHVRSSAGAIGLMQLMPHTAMHTAHLMGHSVSVRHVSEPTINVPIGAYYLKKIYDTFNQNIVLAIAAYNAGPVRVSSWFEGCEPMDAQIFIETIPFLETRNYVKKVLFNIFIYERFIEHKNITIHSFLGMISDTLSKKNQNLIQSLE